MTFTETGEKTQGPIADVSLSWGPPERRHLNIELRDTKAEGTTCDTSHRHPPLLVSVFSRQHNPRFQIHNTQPGKHPPPALHLAPPAPPGQFSTPQTLHMCIPSSSGWRLGWGGASFSELSPASTVERPMPIPSPLALVFLSLY